MRPNGFKGKGDKGGERGIDLVTYLTTGVRSVSIDGNRDMCWFPRKEVIQPHLPIRLPCYDFVPLTGHTFGSCIPCGFTG